MLRELLVLGMDPNGHTRDSSPLLEAISLRSEPLVRLLLEAGADPNHTPDDGISPLVASLDASITRLLVSAGARVPLERGRGYLYTPTGFLEYPGYSVHEAARDGDEERLRILLEEGEGRALLETHDEMGRTPVGLAAESGHVEALRLLLEHGADPNNSDGDHIAYSPLADTTHIGCARLLLEYGADPDHAWGLCATGREELTNRGGEMLRLLHEADRHPERRRLTAESVRRRLGWDAPEPVLQEIGGQTVWVFGSPEGPSLAWNQNKWGVALGGKVRWHPDYESARRHTLL